jgi:uncharacterized phage protein gp47/JayE
MALTTVPAPVLDLRSGDQLAAQAIGALPPELSDRSNSNPFVVLIEAVFARVDALMFQLSQWPSAVIQKALNLVGITLNPAQVSTVLQSFTLTAPQSKDSIVAKGTGVATSDGTIVFSTTADLTITAFTSPAGTVTFTSGSTAVTGSGTTFTALQAGWQISPDQTTWYTISSITNDTNLVLVASATSTVSGTSFYAGAVTGSVNAQSTATGSATKVAAGTLTSLQTQPAGVASTTNAAAAAGGADIETVAQAIARAPQAFTARDTAASASDYAYFAAQILGAPGRAFAQGNTNNTTAQTGYVTVAMLSPSWTTTSAVTAQERANVIRDLAGRTFQGATTIDVAMNIQQFIASPTMPAVLFYRQTSTDQASAQVNVAKAINTYLNPSTYTPGRSVYLGDLEATAKSATGLDRVLSILGTQAIGMSWQQFAANVTAAVGLTLTAGAGDVANMKPYQTFIVDTATQNGYLVTAASGTTITIDRAFAGAVPQKPFFFHAQDTALTNWYSVPFSNLSIDPTAPPASIVVVGVV